MIQNTNPSIFPGLNPTANLQIADCLIREKDIRSIVVLSGVNKEAYDFFSNEEYFKQLVTFWFPGVMAFAASPFPLLCDGHPNKCWKLLACSSAEGRLILNNTFLKSAIPFLCDGLIKDKMSNEIEIQEICGSGYQDPKSPIHIAWESFEQAIKYGAEQFALRESGAKNESEKCPMSDFYHSRSSRARGFYRRNLFVNIFCYVKTEFDCNPSYYTTLSSCSCSVCCSLEDIFHYHNEYSTLESKRLSLEEEKNKINKELDLLSNPQKFLNSSEISFYKKNLTNEFEGSIKKESLLLHPGLCINLIDKIQEGTLKPTPQLVSQVLFHLYSLSPKLQYHVISQLPRAYGEAYAIEQCERLRMKQFSGWFRQHFPQCLEQLRSVLSSIPKEALEM
jgi:hypothetical protein